jgi:hypothetical protein
MKTVSVCVETEAGKREVILRRLKVGELKEIARINELSPIEQMNSLQNILITSVIQKVDGLDWELMAREGRIAWLDGLEDSDFKSLTESLLGTDKESKKPGDT